MGFIDDATGKITGEINGLIEQHYYSQNQHLQR